MVHGPWFMNPGPWYMEHVSWTMNHGPWTMNHDPWSIVNGPWTMVYSLRQMLHCQSTTTLAKNGEHFVLRNEEFGTTCERKSRGQKNCPEDFQLTIET